MAQTQEQITQDLSSVHSFYLYLLETALEDEVPVPALIHDSLILRRFVLLLDIAVTPQMMRDGIKGPEQREAAEALLRFFATKEQRRREDRDKADVIATALYRFMIPDGAPAPSDDEELHRIMVFEEQLGRVYEGIELPAPPNEHIQLVREFQFLRDEVDDFRHFDEMIDAGVIQKVREIKETLDASFLHPTVLGPLASYNVFFGERFDKLFKRAAQEVRSFAERVQQDGGSIMSRVDGEVLVKHLTDVDEGKILNEEYMRAQEDLRRVSKMKKAVDNRRFGKTPPPPKAHAMTQTPRFPMPVMVDPTPFAGPLIARPQGMGPLGPPGRVMPEPPAHTPPRTASGVAEIELQKLNGVQMTIRSFVRAADPASAQVVPMPSGNVTLTAYEVDAYRADYGNEKSFRADYVSALMQLAALDARMLAEWQEFQKTQFTAYSWKPHADALAYLLGTARSLTEQAMQLRTTAHQRGLTDKVAAITESLNKVRSRAQDAAEALQSLGAGSE